MAVTIDEMNVDVQEKGAQPQAHAEAPAAKEPMNFRQEREKMAERELRLRAD